MFLNPIGLVALLGVPVVVAIHLYRRRFRPREVSAVFLWSTDSSTPSSGRRRERLRTGASFWTEVVMACLLGLLFGGPVACGSLETRHLVVVLDSSASMAAGRGADGVAARARAVVRERVDALTRRSRVTLIRSGSRPRVLAGPAALPREALVALEDWEPGASRHGLEASLALAHQLVGEGAVLLVTDLLEPERYGDAVEVVAVGEPRDNVAIVGARRTRVDESGADELFVSVRSFSRDVARRGIELRAGGRAIDARELELAPDQRVHLTWPLPAGTPEVEVALDGDELAIDDSAWLAPPRPRRVRLATTLPAETAELLGLSSGAGAGVDRWAAAVGQAVAVSPRELPQLVIGAEPAADEAAWSLVLSAPGEERADLIGPFLAEKGHPLLDGLTLEGIVWSIDPDLFLDGAPLVSATNRPILVEQRAGARRVFLMNCDPVRSTLQRSPDWPILLANLAELRRAELPGPRHVNVAVGEPITYRCESPGSFRVQRLGEAPGDPIPARAVLVVDDLERPGIYTLRRDEREVCRFGLRFEDPAESDLRGRNEGHRDSALELARVDGEVGWLESVLLALVVALLLVDWVVLERASRAAPA